MKKHFIVVLAASLSFFALTADVKAVDSPPASVEGKQSGGSRKCKDYDSVLLKSLVDDGVVKKETAERGQAMSCEDIRKIYWEALQNYDKMVRKLYEEGKKERAQSFESRMESLKRKFHGLAKCQDEEGSSDGTEGKQAGKKFSESGSSKGDHKQPPAGGEMHVEKAEDPLLRPDFIFIPLPESMQDRPNISPDKKLIVQMRTMTSSPARRLAAEFMVRNSGAVDYDPDAGTETTVKIRHKADNHDWLEATSPMPYLQAGGIPKMVTIIFVLPGTGNDTIADWNENYSYALFELILDPENKVAEQNEGNNAAGQYKYSAPTNSFVADSP